MVVGLLEGSGLEHLKLLLQLLHVLNIGAEDCLLQVVHGVVHPVVECLRKEERGRGGREE